MKLPETILGYPVREVRVLEDHIIAVISVDDVIDQAAARSEWIDLKPTKAVFIGADGRTTETDLTDSAVDP